MSWVLAKGWKERGIIHCACGSSTWVITAKHCLLSKPLHLRTCRHFVNCCNATPSSVPKGHSFNNYPDFYDNAPKQKVGRSLQCMGVGCSNDMIYAIGPDTISVKFQTVVGPPNFDLGRAKHNTWFVVAMLPLRAQVFHKAYIREGMFTIAKTWLCCHCELYW